AGHDALDVVHVVAAPGGVDGPDLAGLVAEPMLAGVQDVGRVVPGAAAPTLATVGADGEVEALWHALGGPASAEVEDLGCAVGDGEGELQLVDGERVLGGVLDGGLSPDEAVF